MRAGSDLEGDLGMGAEGLADQLAAGAPARPARAACGADQHRARRRCAEPRPGAPAPARLAISLMSQSEKAARTAGPSRRAARRCRDLDRKPARAARPQALSTRRFRRLDRRFGGGLEGRPPRFAASARARRPRLLAAASRPRPGSRRVRSAKPARVRSTSARAAAAWLRFASASASIARAAARRCSIDGRQPGARRNAPSSQTRMTTLTVWMPRVHQSMRHARHFQQRVGEEQQERDRRGSRWPWSRSSPARRTACAR